ncbi:tRNA1(Val) (adenine(37)-N6)-methyltransferase [Glaesserella parasuis]|nr:methyltransferase [Glaesserella parasuis]MCT8525504.1 methyltransferase [Glaesserella parasuis]MCT8528621.1 methyltransferase [Glaesserella parasuis]MCT8530777.1 methyltransferase [Glaesserella parasuis]MCT8532661.1 methyltransferase [Glaesserella parasuis]MCT8539014.1 methyltransferase [Glaesserella parasuis]
MSGFQFKQFFIEHDRCAMKVNTDGILLGAIADPSNARQILDLGTGTGLIAIILAQRTASAQITALELEENAFHQAQENAQHCPWNNRIDVLQADIMTWKSTKKFDLIVSNPPYFEHSLASRNKQRDLARAVTYSHFDWLKQSQQWLTPNGRISFILPFDAGKKLLEQSHLLGLYCIEHWEICTKIGLSPKRVILTFSPQYAEMALHTLTIYDENQRYTADFTQFTEIFYLKVNSK